MRAIEIARRLAALEQDEDARKAYMLALNETEDPAEKLEAAFFILQSGGDYRVSYTCFLDLYRQGYAQNDVLSVMTDAFYLPNEKELRGRYEKNCKLLAKYPYLFRKDFPKYEDLPIRFYPFDENGYVPFFPAERRFGEYVDFKDPVVSRNFFKDLEKPILTGDVYSQYELEYLNDNVRPSEYIGRENHIYLHYADWETFCAHLACLNMRPLLADQKIVFLIGDEISQYPIDFKERYGIDYSRYPVKPIGIREIHRLIWATQLSSHNGGDFFNEIFDDHPNLLAVPSYILSNMESLLNEMLEGVNQANSSQEALRIYSSWNNPRLVNDFYCLRDRTQKDALVVLYLREQKMTSPHLDTGSRIAPALFFQPHFHNIEYDLSIDKKGRAVLYSEEGNQIRKSPIFQNFKYIKTFTPMRRITTSYGAMVKFMLKDRENTKEDDGKVSLVFDAIMNRVLNRSFMIDWQNRLYKDCRLVRFEDGKLNPKATFTALAAFVDLPYTESMTYCSLWGERDPESLEGNDRGFDPAAIYRTNDEFTNDAERAYLECFMRDAYETYGYDFMYYDGLPVDEQSAERMIDQFTTLDGYMRQSWLRSFQKTANAIVNSSSNTEEADQEEAKDEVAEKMLAEFMRRTRDNRIEITNILRSNPLFINKDGQPLHMMPKLELDPALLEQPLYH